MGRSSGATLDALILDTTGWTAYSADAFDRCWFDESRNPIRARLLEGPAAEMTLEGWRAQGERETEAKGGMLISFDEVAVDGCRAFRGLFKYLAAGCIPDWPPQSNAVYIVGTISVPLGSRTLILKTEAVERGVLLETHPLTRVRRRQRWVIERVRLGLELKALLLSTAN